MLLTYQDYIADTSTAEEFVSRAISRYQSSEMYKTACIADDYDRQRNKTICEFNRMIYRLNGSQAVDTASSNNRIASNFFRRLNTQRCAYSLGNGVDFSDTAVKEKFKEKFDTVLYFAGYDALIHGVSYLFIGDKQLYEFKATEFMPLWDELTGELRAGIRFWRLAPDKPLIAVLYEEDGYTKFSEITEDGDKKSLFVLEDKKSYIQKIQKTAAFGEEVIGESNYVSLPIVPLWGSRLKQSTLVGMRAAIDGYDIVRSGFANDLQDCAQIYWLVENYGGMQDDDLRKFLDRLKLNHVVSANTADGGRITPYTQEIPHTARKTFLDDIRAGIYEDFGGLDVHTIAAGATNDHIDAAYQPLDENADDFEMQIIECVQKIGGILGIAPEDCVPIFKRNRISNQLEQMQILTMAAQWLDEETIIGKIPCITVDEVSKILERKAAEDAERVPLSVDAENDDINGEAV